MKWIDVITRPLTDAEKKACMENLIDAEDAYVFDCPTPFDGEEVLVITKDGFTAYDTFIKDETGNYFENHPKQGEVIAWSRGNPDDDWEDSEGGLIDEDA